MKKGIPSVAKYRKGLGAATTILIGALGLNALADNRAGDDLIARASFEQNQAREEIASQNYEPETAEVRLAAVLIESKPEEDRYSWPISGKTGIVVSCYGPRVIKNSWKHHDGLDIGAAIGTGVGAVQYGTVESVCHVDPGCECSLLEEECRSRCMNRYDAKGEKRSACGGEGNRVTIRHEDGKYTHYLHLDSIEQGISRGAEVVKGQRIGKVGRSGYSSGPHLHLSISDTAIRQRGNTEDPLCEYEHIIDKLDLERNECGVIYGSRGDNHEPAMALQGCFSSEAENYMISMNDK